MLDEKFKFDDATPEKDSSILNSSEIIRRISEIELRNSQETNTKSSVESLKVDELQSQIAFLNQKLSEQSIRIKFLENKLEAGNIEKLKLLQEIKIIKQEHQLEILQYAKKYERPEQEKQQRNSNDLDDLSNIKYRISILEEKCKLQKTSNEELIENFKNIQDNYSKLNQTEKIEKLEEILIKNVVKYKELKERLDKTESLIALDRTYHSPDISMSKKIKVLSPRIVAKDIKKISKNKSTSSNIVGKEQILQKLKKKGNIEE